MRNNQTSTMKNRILVITTLLLIGIAFWVLNYLTPEYNDDYSYKFVWGNEKPIESIGDIFVSQYNHYFSMNGRSIVHFFVQLFTGILGKGVFNIINTIVFLSFVCIITRFYSKITPSNLLFIFSIIFLLYPIISETALWMTGSINYMWTSTFVCMFLYMIEKHKGEKLCTKYILWSIPCFLIGWTHEGLTFPLAVSLFIYVIINYRTIYKQAIFPLIIGFIIGSLICSFAPGMANRASKSNYTEVSTLISRIIPTIIYCVKLKAFDVLLLMTIVLSVKQKSVVWVKEFYIKNMIVVNALFFSIGLIFFSGCFYLRVATGIELFSIILILSLIQYYNIPITRRLKIIVCTITCLLYSVIVYCSIGNYQEYKRIIAQIKQKQGTTIIPINEINPPFYVEVYILRFLDDTRAEMGNCYYYDNCWNRCIAATYGYDSIAFVPKIVYNDIINNSDKINDIRKQKDYPFYVIPTDNIEGVTPTFILKPTDFHQIPFYIRPVAHRMLRYTATEVPASQYGTINIKGREYFFVNRHDAIDDRVESISLK